MFGLRQFFNNGISPLWYFFEMAVTGFRRRLRVLLDQPFIPMVTSKLLSGPLCKNYDQVNHTATASGDHNEECLPIGEALFIMIFAYLSRPGGKLLRRCGGAGGGTRPESPR